MHIFYCKVSKELYFQQITAVQDLDTIQEISLFLLK